MSTQQAIGFEERPEQESGDTRANAHHWMDQHPEAMAEFVRLALSLAEKGRRFGIGLLAEQVRWVFYVERGDERFVVNNSHRAYIARELVRRYPHLSRFLTFRRTKYEEASA